MQRIDKKVAEKNYKSCIFSLYYVIPSIYFTDTVSTVNRDEYDRSSQLKENKSSCQQQVGCHPFRFIGQQQVGCHPFRFIGQQQVGCHPFRFIGQQQVGCHPFRFIVQQQVGCHQFRFIGYLRQVSVLTNSSTTSHVRRRQKIGSTQSTRFN